jgi:hypothetical protein
MVIGKQKSFAHSKPARKAKKQPVADQSASFSGSLFPSEWSASSLSLSADIYDASAALEKQHAKQQNPDKETKIVPNTVVQDLINSHSVVEQRNHEANRKYQTVPQSHPKPAATGAR